MLYKIFVLLAMMMLTRHQSESRLIKVFRNVVDTDAALPYPIPKTSQPFTTAPPSAEHLIDVNYHFELYSPYKLH